MWIFKQINADSIRISLLLSLFFCCCCSVAFPVVIVVALFAEHSEVAIVVMRHARMRNMLKGSSMVGHGHGHGRGAALISNISNGDGDGDIDTCVCVQQQKQQRCSSLGMRVSRLSPPPCLPPLAMP